MSANKWVPCIVDLVRCAGGTGRWGGKRVALFTSTLQFSFLWWIFCLMLLCAQHFAWTSVDVDLNLAEREKRGTQIVPRSDGPREAMCTTEKHTHYTYKRAPEQPQRLCQHELRNIRRMFYMHFIQQYQILIMKFKVKRRIRLFICVAPLLGPLCVRY